MVTLDQRPLNPVKRLIAFVLLGLILTGCNLSTGSGDNDYQNLDLFDEYIFALAREVGPKYTIREYNFDVECIYEKGDLTEVIDSMLTLGSFEFELIRDGHDDQELDYYTLVQVQDSTYEFRTSSEGDYIDLDRIFVVLDQVVRDHKPDHAYNLNNTDGGQIACMIFSSKENLKKAVDEGYPCTLENSYWPKSLNWSSSQVPVVDLEEVPESSALKNQYYECLKGLYNADYIVPNLTSPRIYIDDIFKDGKMKIIIDGDLFFSSEAKYEGTTFHCDPDGWGLAFAYMLVKYYDGNPRIYDRDKGNTQNISKEDFIELAESSFGKR